MDDKADGYPDNNPKSRIGIKKVQLHLVPPAAVIHEALAMADGAAKYGPYNWRENKVAASVYIAAAKRHLDAWFDGEDVAEDSGVHHLGHARACLGIILDAVETGNLVDDRPAKGAAAEMLARFTKKDEPERECQDCTYECQVLNAEPCRSCDHYENWEYRSG